jgi:cold shock CspA family protein
MRTHGTLVKWNDDQGFGFITPAQGNDEVFVHISAFPRDGSRPRVSELISFDIELGGDGKKRAVRVQRPGSQTTIHRARHNESSKPSRSPITTILGLLVIGAVGAYGYSTLTATHSATPTLAGHPERAAPNQTFRCDGRTHCSQMTSCEEAEYFLRNCPNTQMDGNNDGEPCEQQWCK